MHRPLPLSQIYQPTRLKVRGLPEKSEQGQSFGPQDRVSRSIAQGYALQERVVTVREFLKRGENAVVYAGPGWGKTTFLHHVFLDAVQQKRVLPVLISLRRPTAVADLNRFVEMARMIQKKEGRSETLLLIDGYDELSVEHRRHVSDAILRYDALKVGCFYVTCREYYHVFGVAVPEARIDAFALEDQYRYVAIFLEAFGVQLDSHVVVDDFHDRGLGDFLSHPLLLALACIVKSSAMNIESRSVLRLLERAIDVLTYRWDEEKGIDRERRTPLDGRDRIQVLKRIAYKFRSRHVPDARALGVAQEQLDKFHLDRVDARQVLVETAQFFGIFVPAEDGWEFVHKSLHDFLAAQYWVESGNFANARISEWDARTAYATCLTQDATSMMETTLSSAGGLESFVEILSNAPNFDHKRIADALIAYYSQRGRMQYYEESPNKVTACLDQDFVRLASSRFLDYLVERCCEKRGKVTDTVVGYCLFELAERERRLQFVTYGKAISVYNSADFTFQLLDLGSVRLSSLNPATPTCNPRTSS